MKPHMCTICTNNELIDVEGIPFIVRIVCKSVENSFFSFVLFNESFNRRRVRKLQEVLLNRFGFVLFCFFAFEVNVFV